MRIYFFGPFKVMFGREMELEFQGNLSLREFIDLFASRHKGFASIASFDKDSSLSAHICFLRRGRLLKLDDRLQNEDTLQVLLPVSGG